MGYSVALTLLFLTQFVPQFSCMQFEQGERVVFMTGPRDGKVDLPCYLQPRNEGDRPKLVLWYKAGINTPLFSHDDRGDSRKLPPARYDIDDNQKVYLGRDSATLTKTNLQASDDGMYECRVDFYRSPTSTSLYNLTIMLPPDELEVEGWRTEDRIIADSMSESSHHLYGVVAGPFFEGEKMHLSCTARGGSPRPNVTWWRSGSLIDRGWEVKGLGMVCNDLVVPKLTRDWLDSELMCRATTAPELEELSVSLKVDMILSPSSVYLSVPRSVEAGSKLTLSCTVIGARPIVTVKWLKGNIVFDREDVVVVSSVDLESSSVFHATFDVEAEDDQCEITCSAVNEHLPTIRVYNTTTINVLYAPVVVASLGRSLDAHSLSAGDDVYFSCDVRANPPGGPVQWYREGALQKSAEGVVLSGSDLVLQKVSKEKAGRYWCEAGNEISTSASKPIILNLNYLPECKNGPSVHHIHEDPINVTCHVESVPTVSRFTWRWNYTTEDFDYRVIENDTKNSSDQWSTVEITAKNHKTENQIFQFFCYGINDVGIQDEPCKFIIEYSSTPVPSCLLINITSFSLSVTCNSLEMSDSAIFRAEVYEKSGKLISEVISKKPNFQLSDLDPVTTYDIKVYVSRGSYTATPLLVSALTSTTTAVYSVEETRPKPPSTSKVSSSATISNTSFISLHLMALSFTVAITFLLTSSLYNQRQRQRCCGQKLHANVEKANTVKDYRDFNEDNCCDCNSQKSSFDSDAKEPNSVGSSLNGDLSVTVLGDEDSEVSKVTLPKGLYSNVIPSLETFPDYYEERGSFNMTAIFPPIHARNVGNGSRLDFKRIKLDEIEQTNRGILNNCTILQCGISNYEKSLEIISFIITMEKSSL